MTDTENKLESRIIDNEIKLVSATKHYKLMTILADISPVVGTVLMTIILGLQLSFLPYILKIQAAEKAQDEYRKTMPEWRSKRDSVEQHILDNIKGLDSKLDLIIVNQAKPGFITKSTLDSLKAYIFENK